MSEEVIKASAPATDEDIRLPWLVRARPYLIILPAMLLLIGILYPFVVGVYYSFTAFNFKVPDSQFNFVGLRNYVRMFTDEDFLYSTYITLAYAVITTGVELFLGLIVAMLLNRDSRVAKILTPMLIFPMIIAPVIGTLVWKMMMQPSVGILNPILNFVGLPSLEWAAVPQTALFSVTLVDIWMFTPFAAMMILAGLRSFPNAPFEAARVDGANEWQIFRRITIPLLRPTIAVVTTTMVITVLKVFDIVYVMTNGNLGTEVVANRMYKEMFNFRHFGRASAIAVILLAAVIPVMVMNINRFREQEAQR